MMRNATPTLTLLFALSVAHLRVVASDAAAGHGQQPRVPAGHPSIPAAAPALTGTALETMDSGGYTYIRLKTEKGETWAAISVAKVEKGSTVTIANPMPMDGFESKTLHRRFDRIVFGSLAQPAAGATGGAGTNAERASMAAKHAAAAAGPSVGELISVPRAEGPDGRTVAEVFATRLGLRGRTISVRGKVVKYNAAIMGRNWIHLQDGSGTRDGKDNDLMVTTTDAARVGDVVLVRGVLSIDRDFGSGYAYPVIVENAKLSNDGAK